MRSALLTAILGFAAAVPAPSARLGAREQVTQSSVPEIPFESVGTPDLLKFPDNVHMGEAAGVATNSKGEIFLYTRTGNPTMTLGTSRAVSHGGSRLFQFDKNGKFMREIGTGAYGLLQAQQVRVDAADNVWIVDQMSTQVIKFDPSGRVQLILSRKPEALRVPALALTPPPAGVPVVQPPAVEAGSGGQTKTPPGAGAEGESFQRPTDVAWDKAGDIYVADGFGNARIAKYEPTGKYIKSWGSLGSGPGEFNIVHGLAIDAQGNVYAADEGNHRIQVFDGNGAFKTQFTGIGTPTALCMTTGSPQVLYVAHTGDPDGMEDAAIYKVDLTGKILGKLGRAGKELKQFGLVNAIDCRIENELLVGELSNWRVQRLRLR
jgi:DNA-binding beta-propeller fold protein YncE